MSIIRIDEVLNKPMTVEVYKRWMKLIFGDKYDEEKNIIEEMK